MLKGRSSIWLEQCHELRKNSTQCPQRLMSPSPTTAAAVLIWVIKTLCPQIPNLSTQTRFQIWGYLFFPLDGAHTYKLDMKYREVARALHHVENLSLFFVLFTIITWTSEKLSDLSKVTKLVRANQDLLASQILLTLVTFSKFDLHKVFKERQGSVKSFRVVPSEKSHLIIPICFRSSPDIYLLTELS